jgi:hypothetical protein
MNSIRSRFQVRKAAKEQLLEIWNNRKSTVFIHYSCESFTNRPYGTSPRITSIAVRHLENGQTSSFSIHHVAEVKKIPYGEIKEQCDLLEKEMLVSFYDYVKCHAGYIWLHWNMRDTGYGFQAIEHRFRVLGGDPIAIHESQLHDLARIFIDIFSESYAEHPRLKNICIINNISLKDFLSGAEKAAHFNEGKFFELHKSTLRKVDVFENLLNLISDGRIKTNAKPKDVYGDYFCLGIYFIREHWFFVILGLIGTIASIFGLLHWLLSPM